MDVKGPACDEENPCRYGVCDPVAGVCVDCLTDEDCIDEKHCVAKECILDVCEQGSRSCANEWTTLVCSDNGDEEIETVCPEEEVCAWGECLPPMCEAYSKWCTDDYYMAVCDGSGTAVQKVLCPPGFACYDGGCSPIYHNIYVVFDTSGSMYSSVSCGSNAPFCEYAWPECEKKGLEFSRIGFCKAAFYTVFTTLAAEGGNANFALFRFPQGIKTSPDCDSGYYDSQDYMSGDDGSHVTPDGPESWFDSHLYQVVSVLFPADLEASLANLGRCLKWVDFVETLEPDPSKPCVNGGDCQGGSCKLAEGEMVCHYHSNPELRAEGWTPLGRTMFYAGEYVRKYAAVEGKPCLEDADCQNVNYQCGPAGTCHDPLRHCRANLLLLFTDGGESEFPSPNNFFNPAVQAKRFHYGLGCETDDDCLNGATCDVGFKICMPEDNSFIPAPYKDDQGANLLLDYNGDPIEMAVHVVYAGDDPDVNKAIAENGGGGYYPVQGDDLQELVATILSIVDIKDNLEQCIPNVPEVEPPEDPQE